VFDGVVTSTDLFPAANSIRKLNLATRNKMKMRRTNANLSGISGSQTRLVPMANQTAEEYLYE
jgi:hypothetical protein